jgi:nucleotide-binding universal stress UspA family protein
MMFGKILVASDGSENAYKALERGCELAAADGAELHLIVVEEVPEVVETIAEVKDVKTAEDRQARAIIRRSQAIATRSGLDLHPHVAAGHVVRSIVDFAKGGRFGLIIIGATGHAAIYERMLGTRADRIAHLAHCPVLIAR